jgi:hypothetical protein
MLSESSDPYSVKPLTEKLEIKLSDKDEPMIKVVATDGHKELTELQIRPGQTVSARLVVDRAGFKEAISFGKEDSGRNLPHGSFVDNIGLNGLLIPEGQTEREFFITAAPKLAPGRYQFHLRAEIKKTLTTKPIWLNVVP